MGKKRVQWRGGVPFVRIEKRLRPILRYSFFSPTQAFLEAQNIARQFKSFTKVVPLAKSRYGVAYWREK